MLILQIYQIQQTQPFLIIQQSQLMLLILQTKLIQLLEDF